MIEGILGQIPHLLHCGVQGLLYICHWLRSLLHILTDLSHKVRAFHQLVLHFQHGTAQFLADCRNGRHRFIDFGDMPLILFVQLPHLINPFRHGSQGIYGTIHAFDSISGSFLYSIHKISHAACQFLRFFRKFPYFSCHHGKALASLACPGRLHGRVQSQKVRLHGNRTNSLDDFIHILNDLYQFIHVLLHLPGYYNRLL